jgi:Flagellar biosynthesis pathway, component FlhB
MADKDNRTEPATPQRIRKARREGRFAVSGEFVAALQFLAFVALLSWQGASWFQGLLNLMRHFLRNSASITIGAGDIHVFLRQQILPVLLPMLCAGMGLLVISVGSQLGTTQMGFSLNRLAPDLKRLNPINNLRQIPRRNLPSLVQALLLLPLFGAALYAVVTTNLSTYLSLPLRGLDASVRVVFQTMLDLLWRAAFAFLLLGAIDLFRQRRRYYKDLRMSKQEIRDELKESEGNPQVKMRLRRMQRELLRRQMMKEVPTATAVIVNPTHFAVAIRYQPETMAAPRVVAKGKNLIALRIRQIATDHQVPIVENPPLAQALYKSVQVGEEIPAHFYRAVAEVLAYIFRLMNQRLPG